MALLSEASPFFFPLSFPLSPLPVSLLLLAGGLEVVEEVDSVLLDFVDEPLLVAPGLVPVLEEVVVLALAAGLELVVVDDEEVVAGVAPVVVDVLVLAAVAEGRAVAVLVAAGVAVAVAVGEALGAAFGDAVAVAVAVAIGVVVGAAETVAAGDAVAFVCALTPD